MIVGALIAPPTTDARGFDAAGMTYLADVVPGGHGPWLEAVDARADGTIVAAGVEDEKLVVVRLRADGQPDPTFGSDGAVAERVGIKPDGSMTVTAQAIASTADGGVVVVGGARFGSDRMRLFVRRYDANGMPVNSFAAAGTFVLAHSDAHTSLGSGVAVDAAGRIVVSGHLNTYSYSYSPSDLIVLRLLPDGQLDRSYGVEGRTAIPEGGVGGTLRLATNGDALVISTTRQIVPPPSPGGSEGYPEHTEVSRFNDAGVRTSTIRWRQTYSQYADNPASDLTLLPGDRPLIASCDQHGASRAFAAFDSELSAASLIQPPFGACPTAVATLADGRIAWAGEAFAGPRPGVRWAIGLLSPDGTPDPGFAGGSVVTDAAENPASILYPVRAINAEGDRIVAAGLDRQGQFITSLGPNGARWVAPPTPTVQVTRPPGRLPAASVPKPTASSLGKLPRTVRIGADGRLLLTVRCTRTPCTMTATATVRFRGSIVRYTTGRSLTKATATRLALRPVNRPRGQAVRRTVHKGGRLKARVRVSAVSGQDRTVTARTVTVVR